MKQSINKILAGFLVLGAMSCASSGAGCYDFGNVEIQSNDDFISTIDRNFIPKKNPDLSLSDVNCD